MIWVIVSTGIAVILMVLLGYHALVAKRTGKPKGRGISEGFAIGLLVSAAICISLREIGGYRSAPDFFLPCGIALGGVIGFFLEKRYQEQ